MPEKSVWPKPKPKKPSIIDRLHSQIPLKAFIVSHSMILILALIFLGGFYYILNNDNRVFDTSEYKPVTRPPQSFNLSVSYPEDDSVVSEKNITISGLSAPSSTVILTTINSNETTVGFEADSKGNFSKIVTLNPGLNQIIINSFDRLGNTKLISRSVYFSEEQI